MKSPTPLISLIPLLTLVAMVSVSILLFGSNALSGANQISLLMATGVCACIAMGVYKMKWKEIEDCIMKTIGGSAVSIVILLLIGMMSSAWMVSGTVPTLIYYGIQVMSPSYFLVCSCVICAVVSLMTGSSWTTVATIGIALLGIGDALGVSNAWTAGAIISGAYFGDKISPLSDTTVLASTAARVNIFEHIQFMLRTTVPTFCITLIIFLLAGIFIGASGETEIGMYTKGLSQTFNISLWTLIIPVFTAVLILKKVPALITLFLSGLGAGVMAIILQPELLRNIVAASEMSSMAEMCQDSDTWTIVSGTMITFFTSTNIETGNAELNDLVGTSGMQGMLDTVWLILCAMCFGGAMTATGMLQSITQSLVRFVVGKVSLVSCTAGSGLALNLMTSDQYMSIVLTADMYREVYEKMGYEHRLLSRTTEDSTTVTSVLIPWNTCGMTQATVLGVPTLTYLPFCFFNYLSPVMTILMAMKKKN